MAIYKKKRLDQLLVDSGVAPTRSRAADLIRRGQVSVAGKPERKPGALVAPGAAFAVNPEACAYVSRGGLKLAAALDAFGFDPKGKVALDLGASTGGFTDVLIARGAAKVYAVDVGKGQLHAKLRANRRVVALEGTDARALDRTVIGEEVSAIVADVSFIGLALVLPAALRLAAPGAWLVALVKPQFEAGREAVGKGGVVRSEADRLNSVAKIRKFVEEQAGWTVVGEIVSPIRGGSGNEEFLIGARHGVEVEIARLGGKGDGVAEGAGAPLYVPFALPGETVRVAVEAGSDRAELLDVLKPSPDRVAPVCPHFGVCGGCALQHLEKAAYLDWKRATVVAALRARGLEADVEKVRPVPLGDRRRAILALAREKAGTALGYRRARSHELIDIAVCPVLSPGIVARLPGLKAALAPLVTGWREARVGITETPAGLDIVLEGARPGEAALAAFAGQAARLGVARLTCDGGSIGPVAAPEIEFSGVKVKLPAGAFLQASAEAEAVMAGLVREGVGDARSVADLFAGLGTFTFALARAAAVDAFEADEAALQALAEAWRKTQGLKPVRTFSRDLFRAPLGPAELRAYDALVFDPPRAGAASQAAKLAASKVPRLVAVSCYPGTLARDLRILADGGYRIARVVPVDQFLYAPHVEVVAHLER